MVDLEKTGSFVNACAQGSPLLMEHTVKMQIPAVKEKAKQVREWAKRAVVFKL